MLVLILFSLIESVAIDASSQLLYIYIYIYIYIYLYIHILSVQPLHHI